MQTLNHINKVSAFFFFVLAFFYMGLALMFRNAFMGELVFNLMRILDLPMAFVALLYGGSALALQIKGEKEGISWGVLLIAALGLGLFIAFAFIQLSVPSQI